MKKSSVRKAPPPPSKRRWGLWLLLVVMAGLGVWVLTRTVGRKIPEPGEVGRRGMAGERGERGERDRARPTATAPANAPTMRADGRRDDEPPPFDPAAAPVVLTREQWIADRKRIREVYLEKSQYPIGSRPLEHKTDLLLPNHVEPTVRPLKHDADAGDQAGKVSMRLNQDRIYLKPGDVATVTLEAFRDGQPVGIDSVEATFHRIEERRETTPLAVITFTDDGVAPDAAAGDLTYSARVAVPVEALAGYTGPVAVIAKTKVGSEDGSVDFRFVATAPPPARFTGAIREALEDGSLAFYLGVQVETAGKYIGQARLYDADEHPIALLSYNLELGKGPAEIRVLAYGKLIRDEGAKMPMILRDIEGWRMLVGVYPDREVMTILDPRYRTRTYAMESFTDKPYDGPDKQQMLQTIDDATQSGMPAAAASGPLGRRVEGRSRARARALSGGWGRSGDAALPPLAFQLHSTPLLSPR